MSTPSTPTLDSLAQEILARKRAKEEAQRQHQERVAAARLDDAMRIANEWLSERPGFVALLGGFTEGIDASRAVRSDYPTVYVYSVATLNDETLPVTLSLYLDMQNHVLNGNTAGLHAFTGVSTVGIDLPYAADDYDAQLKAGELASTVLENWAAESARAAAEPEPEPEPEEVPDLFPAPEPQPDAEPPDFDPLDFAVDAIAELNRTGQCDPDGLSAAQLAIGIEFVRCLRQLSIALSHIATCTL